MAACAAHHYGLRYPQEALGEEQYGAEGGVAARRMVAAPMKESAPSKNAVSRLDKTFKDAANKEAALVSYITGGYPSPETLSSCCSPSRRAAPT